MVAKAQPVCVLKKDSSSHLRVNDVPDLPRTSPYMLEPSIPADGWPTFLRPPFANTVSLVVQEY